MADVTTVPNAADSSTVISIKDHSFEKRPVRDNYHSYRCRNCGFTVIFAAASEEEELQRLRAFPGCVSVLAKVDPATVEKLKAKGGCRSCGSR